MEPKKSTNSSIHLLAGSVSGLVSCILLQPLDLAKTRIQEDNSKNTWRTVRDIAKKDSIFALWRGTVPTLIRNVPGSGLYFYTLHLVRQNLSKLKINDRQIVSQNFINLCGGVIARVGVGYLMMPITVVKIRYESNFYNYSSLYDACRKIIAMEGVKGMFTGYGVTAMRDAPYAGIYVFFYENLKNLLSVHSDMRGNQILVNMTSGLFGGICATVVTQPFDLVKTKLQLNPQKYKNMAISFKMIYENEGFKSFFVGGFPRILRKSLSAAISWSIYEEIIKNI